MFPKLCLNDRENGLEPIVRGESFGERIRLKILWLHGHMKKTREAFSGMLDDSPALKEAVLASTRGRLGLVRLPAGFF